MDLRNGIFARDFKGKKRLGDGGAGKESNGYRVA